MFAVRKANKQNVKGSFRRVLLQGRVINRNVVLTRKNLEDCFAYFAITQKKNVVHAEIYSGIGPVCFFAI